MGDKIYSKDKSLYSGYGVQRAECTEQIDVPLVKRAAAESEGRVGGQLESKKFVRPDHFFRPKSWRQFSSKIRLNASSEWFQRLFDLSRVASSAPSNVNLGASSRVMTTSSLESLGSSMRLSFTPLQHYGFEIREQLERSAEAHREPCVMRPGCFQMRRAYGYNRYLRR